MLDYDELRKVLSRQAILAVQALAFPCKIGNEAFVTPTDGSIYGEFWFRTGVTVAMGPGGAKAYERTPGLYQFTLYSPEKRGEGEVSRLAERLRKIFNRKQFLVPPDGYVTLGVSGVQDLPGVKTGHNVFVVDASFQFFHHDPAAVDFERL